MRNPTLRSTQVGKCMIFSASFFTAKSCRVAEQTIICSLVPSDVIFGIWEWMRLMSCSYL